MKVYKKIITAFFISVYFCSGIFSSSFFTGNAGGKLNYSSNPDAENYDANLNLEAFFESQLNFSDNLWGHLNFSIDTLDFLSVNLFSAVDSKFKIDEISLIFKIPMKTTQDYLSVFMGTYDPIGSDIFLQRYLAQKPIVSKLTESWLGQASSVLYPHFGIGISDVLKFGLQPLALGTYFYVNNENASYYVLNGDLRFAGAYRFATFDIAGGIGFPITNNFAKENPFSDLEKVYWHAGLTLLLGNNYTQSIFMQAGIFNASFKQNLAETDTIKDDLFILVEPRFKIKNTHVNFTAYSIPQKTVDQLLFIDDTLGVNLNIYSETLRFGNKNFTLGTNIAWSFPNKYFTDLKDPKELVVHGDFNVNIIPYISTSLVSGEIHGQIKLQIMDLIKDRWYDGLGADIGYRLTF